MTHRVRGLDAKLHPRRDSGGFVALSRPSALAAGVCLKAMEPEPDYVIPPPLRGGRFLEAVVIAGLVVIAVCAIAPVVANWLLSSVAGAFGPPAALRQYGNVSGGISRYAGPERLDGMDLWHVCPRGSPRGCFVVGLHDDLVTPSEAVFLALAKARSTPAELAILASHVLSETVLVGPDVNFTGEEDGGIIQPVPSPHIDGDRLVYWFLESNRCNEATVNLSTGAFERTVWMKPCATKP